MSFVPQYTPSGEQHGLIAVYSNSVVFDDFKAMKPKTAEEARKQKKNDARLVKVRYINSRGKHERLTKPYCRWAGERIEQWHLIPGYLYEVPYGFVKEVNGVENPIRAGLMEVDGVAVKPDNGPLEKDQQGEKLHQLVPADFVLSA